MIEVSAALIVAGGRLLIARRPPGTHLAGRWEFPGGKREPGESWEACLAREIREELSCDIRVDDLFHECVHTYPERSVRLRFYWCRLLVGTPTPFPGSELAWIQPGDLNPTAFPDADAEVLERLRHLALDGSGATPTE